MISLRQKTRKTEITAFLPLRLPLQALKLFVDCKLLGGTDMFFFARPNIISRVFAHLPNEKDTRKPGPIYTAEEDEPIRTARKLGITLYLVNFVEYQLGRDWDHLRPEQIQNLAEDTPIQTQSYFIKFCRKLFVLVKKIIKAFVPYALLWLYRKLKGRL
jgi:hypothetical protein